MNQLRSKLLKNSTIKWTSSLADSEVLNNREVIPTSIPMINVALSGSINGGISPGSLMLAGPSKHFKSGFALVLANAFLRKHPEGTILFYDSEFGSPLSYFESFGINNDNVIHTPVTDIEQLKFDMMQQLENVDRGEHLMIIIDSIGNLASKKEVEDALEGKSAADMTRAKQFKSLFRMITPHLALKGIPLVAINHTYKTHELYSKDVVGGGTGPYYGADNIWILGRQQEKDKDNDVAGYNFVINIEKSRYVKEKSKIIISTTFDNGINKWSGLLDVALDGGYVVSPKKGWYAVVDRETGEVLTPNKRATEIENSKEFWVNLFTTTDFATYIETQYKLSSGNIIDDSDRDSLTAVEDFEEIEETNE